MKIAICSAGSDPAGPVYPHFGGAPWLLIHDGQTGTWEALDNAGSHAGGQCAGGRLARTLSSVGVNALVTGQCGAGVLAAFGAVGIPIYRTQDQSVQDAAQAMMSGHLTLLSQACAHEGHEQGHGHHHHGNGGCHQA